MEMIQERTLRYLMVKVDAVLCDDRWVYNDTLYISTFTVKPGVNASKKFRNELNKHGIKLKPGFMKTEDHHVVMEAKMIKTGKPLYAAILI